MLLILFLLQLPFTLRVRHFNGTETDTAEWSHWVTPEVGYPKLEKALKDDGNLILLWNKEPQPSYEVYQILDEVYQKQVPSLSRYEARGTTERILRELGDNVVKSGLFKDLVFECLECQRSYSIDDYLTLLSTLSPYIV
ncbi:MAG: hypothetical protein WBF90_22855 [Rivularia sp. (in: cyanobacteria)]